MSTELVKPEGEGRGKVEEGKTQSVQAPKTTGANLPEKPKDTLGQIGEAADYLKQVDRVLEASMTRVVGKEPTRCGKIGGVLAGSSNKPLLEQSQKKAAGIEEEMKRIEREIKQAERKKST